MSLVAFFISLPLRASGARLLERDLVLVNTLLAASTPVHTQDSSRRSGFLRWIGAWPSPALTISSSFVEDPPRDRDGSRILYASRSSGSGESPLRYTSEFLFSWLRACKRTSSVLAGESHLPGVGGVVNRVFSPLLLAPPRAALRPLGLSPRALGSTLSALLLIRSLRLTLLRSTLLSLALARTRRDEEISGDLGTNHCIHDEKHLVP